MENSRLICIFLRASLSKLGKGLSPFISHLFSSPGLGTPKIMTKGISKVSMPLELFYQKFNVIQREYRKGLREAVKKTEMEKEQKAFHLSLFFPLFFFFL